MRELTKKENKIIKQLGKAFDGLMKLTPAHSDDLKEFTFHIHAAQNIILSRPATEDIQPWE